MAIQNEFFKSIFSSNKAVGTSKATSVARTGRVKTFQQYLEVTNVPTHVNPTLKLMQAKQLPVKF